MNQHVNSKYKTKMCKSRNYTECKCQSLKHNRSHHVMQIKNYSKRPMAWKTWSLLPTNGSKERRDGWMEAGERDGMRQEMKGFLRFHSPWPHQCDHGFYELSFSTPTHHLTRARAHTHTHTHSHSHFKSHISFTGLETSARCMCFCLTVCSFSHTLFINLPHTSSHTHYRP